MNRLLWIVAICLVTSISGQTQNSAVDPVSSRLRELLDRYSANLIATAEEFPADKYSYHPTPAQMTVGQTLAHVADVNNVACSQVAGVPAPEQPKVSETDKNKLVEQLKASMEFCKQVFAKLTDAKMGDPAKLWRARLTTRFAAASEVTDDLIDHYAALAVYLRLNGLLPPTAQPKKIVGSLQFQRNSFFPRGSSAPTTTPEVLSPNPKVASFSTPL
jgi:uncharacterized damage-inducible protein DinB